MIRITLILLLVANITFGQTVDRIQRSYPLENELKAENFIDRYHSFDFSPIWTQTENSLVFGIIGDEHQRIKIRLISVTKNPGNPNEYAVNGKSNVQGTICDFSGKIILAEIKEVQEIEFGVDDEYKDQGIQSQGIIIADYRFEEDPKQYHSGIFEGKLYSKWYLDSDNQIQYDNIEYFSDGYTNNAFVGTWKSHSAEDEKICNWADYRVPIANGDFDIGAGLFSPSEKYYDQGWENYQRAWLYGDEEAKKTELDEWWK